MSDTLASPPTSIEEPPNIRRNLSLKMTVTARQMHKRFDQSVADIGVTRSQWTLIAVIARHPGVTQRDIAEMLEMSEASTGRLIDRLCGDGMLVRQPKPDDRRAYCIHLTEAASSLLDRISSVAVIHENAIFAGLGAEDLARLEGYLDRIATNIAAMR